MSKLVDKERLAKLAQGLYTKLHSEVAAEAEARALLDARVVKLENLHKGDNSVENQIAAAEERAKTYAANQDTALENRVQLKLDAKANKAAYEEHVLAYQQKVAALDAEDARIEGLVGTEKTRAEGEEERIEGLVTDEATARQEADSALSERIAKFEAGGSDSVASIKAELEGKINAVDGKADKNAADILTEKGRAEGKEAELQAAINKEVQDRGTAVQEVQDEVDALEGVVAQQKTDLQAEIALKADQTALQSEAEARAAGDAALQAKITAEENRAKGVEQGLQEQIDAIVGEGEGSIADQIADAIAQEVIDRNAAIEVEADRAVAEEALIRQEMAAEASRVNTKIGTDIAKEAELREAADQGLDARIKAFEVGGANDVAKVLEDAKDYADAEIAKLVDSAPEAMNTLNELAEAIKTHGDEYEAYVATVTADIKSAKEAAIADAKAKDDALKAELQKEIDDDVKVVTDALANEKNAEIQGSLAQKIAAEVTRADEEEKAIRKAFADADSELEVRVNAAIKVNTDEIANQKNVNKEGSLAHQINAEKVRAEGQEAAIRGEFAQADTALGGRIDGVVQDIKDMKDATKDGSLAKEIAGAKGRLDVAEADIKQAKADIARIDGAIAGDIENALKPYSTTEQMKAIIGNVVNSLALAMEGNKMVLKLGGVDGIALASTDLDMATDGDIDEIIAGLK